MKQNNIYDFQQYETIRSFGDNNYTGKMNKDEVKIGKSNLLKNIVECNSKSRPITIGKDKKNIFDVTNKILSHGSNYIVDVVMWPKFGNSSIPMRKVIITSTL